MWQTAGQTVALAASTSTLYHIYFPLLWSRLEYLPLSRASHAYPLHDNDILRAADHSILQSRSRSLFMTLDMTIYTEILSSVQFYTMPVSVAFNCKSSVFIFRIALHRFMYTSRPLTFTCINNSGLIHWIHCRQHRTCLAVSSTRESRCRNPSLQTPNKSSRASGSFSLGASGLHCELQNLTRHRSMPLLRNQSRRVQFRGMQNSSSTGTATREVRDVNDSIKTWPRRDISR